MTVFLSEEKMDILDQTETNLVALRRTVYLTIQSRYFSLWQLHGIGLGLGQSATTLCLSM
jgi:hypothetical protein